MQCSFVQAETHEMAGWLEDATQTLTNVGMNVASAFGTVRDSLYPAAPETKSETPAWIVPAGIAAGGLLLLALIVGKSGGRR